MRACDAALFALQVPVQTLICFLLNLLQNLLLASVTLNVHSLLLLKKNFWNAKVRVLELKAV